MKKGWTPQELKWRRGSPSARLDSAHLILKIRYVGDLEGQEDPGVIFLDSKMAGTDPEGNKFRVNDAWEILAWLGPEEGGI